MVNRGGQQRDRTIAQMRLFVRWRALVLVQSRMCSPYTHQYMCPALLCFEHRTRAGASVCVCVWQLCINTNSWYSIFMCLFFQLAYMRRDSCSTFECNDKNSISPNSAKRMWPVILFYCCRCCCCLPFLSIEILSHNIMKLTIRRKWTSLVLSIPIPRWNNSAKVHCVCKHVFVAAKSTTVEMLKSRPRSHLRTLLSFIDFGQCVNAHLNESFPSSCKIFNIVLTISPTKAISNHRIHWPTEILEIIFSFREETEKNYELTRFQQKQKQRPPKKKIFGLFCFRFCIWHFAIIFENTEWV